MENDKGLSAWEKMQLDMVYDDFDHDLFNRRVDAKNIFNKFNRTTDEQAEERKELLRQLFGSIGENVYVEPTFKCEFGKNIYIGNDVYINFGATFLDCSRITIGNNVLIGPNVGMYSGNHSLDPEERAQGALIPPLTHSVFHIILTKIDIFRHFYIKINNVFDKIGIIVYKLCDKCLSLANNSNIMNLTLITTYNDKRHCTHCLESIEYGQEH